MKMSPDTAKSLVYLVGGIVAIILIVVIIKKVFGGFDALLESLGLKDSEEEKANKAGISDAVNAANSETSSSPWSPIYYQKAPSGTPLFSKATADNICKDIWSSVGVFTDDPAKALSAIKLCPNRACVSWVVDRFRANYGHDLLTWLKDKFDTKYQVEVLNSIVQYVNNIK